jgi:hypothetical protein
MTSPDSVKLPIATFAGFSYPSGRAALAAQRELHLTGPKPPGGYREDESYTTHVVWAPLFNDPAHAPPYLSVLNIFYELMYWRGLIFGPASMSPFTYELTTGRRASDLGQVILT